MPVRTGEEILKFYQSMLHEYLTWSERQQKLHGQDPLNWPEDAFKTLREWNVSLAAVQKAIGLNDAEDACLVESLQQNRKGTA